jgi:hypothetical protein
MAQSDVLTMGEASKVLGLTKSRISQLAAGGALEARMVGGRKVVTRPSVLAYASARRKKGAAGRGESASAVKLTLMCAEYEVARLLYEPSFEYPFEILEVLDPDRMPFGSVTSGGRGHKREFNSWWEHRSVPDSRPGMFAKLAELSARESWELPARGLGLSLSDCYWVRPDGRDDLLWSALNYFQNDFEGCGRDGGDWGAWLDAVGLDSPDNTSEGQLPKRWVIRDGVRVLVKGCGSNDQQPFNEVVATALHARLLRIGEFVPYELVDVGGMPACSCPDFLGPREEYVPTVYVKDAIATTRGASVYDRLCRFAGMHGQGDAPVREALSKMIVCDSILANSDRHWRNFGFVRNIDTLELRPAPIFDSGNCLWYEKNAAQVAARDRSFSAKPFGPEPERQLALVDAADWFDASALDGFVDEAVELLGGSSHASAPGRMDFIAHSLRMRIGSVIPVMGVLRYRA